VWGIGLVCGGITLPIGFLIVKACPDTIAEEIIESARMYGVKFPPGVLRIFVPLTVPGLATALIFLIITAGMSLGTPTC
jgi:raffinose/stachyose/melibiose transport system permease protein